MKRLSWMTVLVIGLLVGRSAPAQVTTSVNWATTTGKTASGFHSGLNLFQGFDPAVAGSSGNTTYKNNLAAMKPGMIRYHRWDMIQDSTTNSSGWATGLGAGQTVGWDSNKINTTLSGLNTWGAVTLMNVPGWPDKWKTSGTGKLDPTHYADFASWCASLVRIINVNQGRGVKYWEVTNELDNAYGANCDELGRIYNQAAAAMKQVDPTIKVGGPAFARPDLTAQVDAFFSTAAPNLDFVSYHSYASGSTSDTNQSLFNTAAGWGWVTSTMKTEFAKYSTRTIQYFHDEYNISWNPPDTRMNNEIGMIFDALTIIATVNAGADAALAWNEADGWYGKLDGGYNRRSSSYLYQIFNTDLGGSVVQTTTSDAGKVVLLGTVAGSWVKLALVNRAESAQTVTFSTLGGLPTGASDSTAFTVKQISSSGLSYASVTVGQLKSGYSLPANTVTVLVLDTSTIPPPASGVLTVSFAAAPSGVNLATEGTVDWIHWGLSTTYSLTNHALDRKSGANQISDFTVLVADSITRYTDFPTQMSWTGGTPTGTANNTQSVLQLYRWWSEGNGFRITVPAGTTQRTLKLYCGTSNATGQIKVTLSDNTATAVTQTLSGTAYRNTDGVYTIVFKAGSASQILTVEFTEIQNLGGYSPSAVRLAGASLR